jgi:hypothetical protein
MGTYHTLYCKTCDEHLDCRIKNADKDFEEMWKNRHSLLMWKNRHSLLRLHDMIEIYNKTQGYYGEVELSFISGNYVSVHELIAFAKAHNNHDVEVVET